ncbi:hypothetical protein KY328_05405, partial [Candidatus Woesearchaeota archaeon]|nr:hypothetical protein [Candidatus Woesearchaeota archaeon]
MRKSPKRGQMEVFGLAVIVILLVIGMLFMIRWVIVRPQQQARQASSYINKEMASNIVVYMLNVNVDPGDVCGKNLDITDLIRDCALGGGIRCPGEFESLKTCGIVKKIIKEDIFDELLGKYGHTYYFKIYKSTNLERAPIFYDEGSGDESFLIANTEAEQECKGTKVSGISFIPLPPDVL